MSEKRKYRTRRAVHVARLGQTFPAGAVVELTADEAKADRNSLTLVDQPAADSETTKKTRGKA